MPLVRSAAHQDSPLEAGLAEVALASLAELPAVEVLRILGPYMRQGIGLEEPVDYEFHDLQTELRSARNLLGIERSRLASVLALIRTDIRGVQVPWSCEGVRCVEPKEAIVCGAAVVVLSGELGRQLAASEEQRLALAKDLDAAAERAAMFRDDFNTVSSLSLRYAMDLHAARAIGRARARHLLATIRAARVTIADLATSKAAWETRSRASTQLAAELLPIANASSPIGVTATWARHVADRNDRPAESPPPAAGVAYQLAHQRVAALEAEREKLVEALAAAVTEAAAAERRARNAEAHLDELEAWEPRAPRPSSIESPRPASALLEHAAPSLPGTHRQGRPRISDHLLKRPREVRKINSDSATAAPIRLAPPPAPSRVAAVVLPAPRPVPEAPPAPPAVKPPAVSPTLIPPRVLPIAPHAPKLAPAAPASVTLPKGSLVQITVQKKAEPAVALQPPVAPELVTSLDSRVHCAVAHANIAARVCVMNLDALKAGKGVRGKNTSALHQARSLARAAEKCITCTSGPRVVARLEQLVQIKSKPTAVV